MFTLSKAKAEDVIRLAVIPSQLVVAGWQKGLHNGEAVESTCGPLSKSDFACGALQPSIKEVEKAHLIQHLHINPGELR